MKIICLIIALTSTQICIAQVLPPKQPSPQGVKHIHSGHSLTDPLFNHWPGQYVNLMGEVNNMPAWQLFNTMVGKSTIPGSSIQFRWNNAVTPNARTEISDWELLSITERVPLMYEGGSTQQWYLDALEDQRQNLSLFVNNAWNNGNSGNGAPTLLWTTWGYVDGSSGDFRQMLDVQGVEWEMMQDYANDNRPNGAPPVYIIPGHKMMARLYDDIALGNVPGISSIDTFFSDNIHLSGLGEYAVTLIHYATIFNQSPVGLPNNLQSDPPVEGTLIPSPPLATYLQTMIWEEVTGYSRSGVRTVLPVELINFAAKAIDQDFIKLEWETASEINNDFFTVERSKDGKQWQKVSKVSGKGNSSIFTYYEALDRSPLSGKSYYRLKQTDHDGQFKYSKIVPVDIENWEHSQLQVYPNPASDHFTIEGDEEELKEINIYNILGQNVTKLARTIILSEDKMEIDITSLTTGYYYVIAKTTANKVYKQ